MRSLRSQPRGPTTLGDEETDHEPPAPRGSDEPAAREMAAMLTLGSRRVPIRAFCWAWRANRPHSTSRTSAACSSPRRPARVLISPRATAARPRDPVNALLSFAYAMLAKDCFSAVCTVGFDPYQGFYHAGRHGRPSLALDLMEEFRPVIADSVVLTLINNGMLTDADFLTWRDACHAHGRRPQDVLRDV